MREFTEQEPKLRGRGLKPHWASPGVLKLAMVVLWYFQATIKVDWSLWSIMGPTSADLYSVAYTVLQKERKIFVLKHLFWGFSVYI